MCYPLMEIFWSADDESYIAIVHPSVPSIGGISAFGDTPYEAAYELTESIDLALGIDESAKITTDS